MSSYKYLSGADQRAWLLLRPHLTEAQVVSLLRDGYFDVKARRWLRIRRYRIHARGLPIEQIKWFGIYRLRWCIHLVPMIGYPHDPYDGRRYPSYYDGYPNFDQLLAWKLLVESKSGQRQLRRTGNVLRRELVA